MSEYDVVLGDLNARREELTRRLGAMQGELKALDQAIAVLQPLAPNAPVNGTRSEEIVQYVRSRGMWVRSKEIIYGICPHGSAAYSAQRHVIATLVGQLADRGRLQRAGRLYGLPDWQAPTTEQLASPELVSNRNGRRMKIELVLRESHKPMHVREICADLERRGWDGDERCVASALAIAAKQATPPWRKVGPAIFEVVEAVSPALPQAS